MDPIHALLRRQLKRIGIANASMPPPGEAWLELLKRVSRSYAEADQDHYTLERSLEISSREMRDLYRRLAAERDKLQAVLRSLGDGLCHTDREGRIQFLNPQAEVLLGWTAAEATGKSLFEIVQTRTPDGGLTPLAPDILQEVHLSAECYVRHDAVLVRRDGSELVATYTVSPLLEGSEPTGTVFLFRDITERKRAERELREARLAAETANTAKSAFLANMSHEIRTPMNGVVGMIELLLETPLNSVQREYAETVRGSAEALLRIINDILDFSKIEAGKYELESTVFDVRQAIEDVAMLLADRAQRKGLELLYLVHHDVPQWVRGDPARLRQVLTNLAGNAVKFTDHGEVLIRANVESLAGEQVTLRLDVSDTGIGIPQSEICRLFESFSQLDNSLTRRHGGTGLGLAISKKLVELMGGEVTLESVVGQGSTFSFTVRLEAVGGESQPRIEEEAELEGRRALVVDDNETNRRLLRSLLERWKVECDLAVDAFDGLDRLERAHRESRFYDVVIIDMQMPGMDGLEFAQRIRARPAFARLPLVVLTSLEGSGHMAEARDAGIDAFLSKPVRQSQLLACLKKTLRASRGDSPPAEMITASTLSRRESPESPRVLLGVTNVWDLVIAVGCAMRLGYHADFAESLGAILEAVNHYDYEALIVDGEDAAMRVGELLAALRGSSRDPVRRLVVIGLLGRSTGEEAPWVPSLDGSLAKPVRASELDRCLRALQEMDRAKGGVPVLEGSEEVHPCVLLAEDNAINQRVAAAMLTKLGLSVDVVNNGAEAVKAWAGKRYALVFMDCQMPEMDGYAATGAIRERERGGPRTPIIAMTANALKGDREEALAAGMDDYIAKPVTMNALRELLRRWMKELKPADRVTVR
ncbi:MAG: response regulator [Planctomycetota bacterium]